MIDGVIIKNLKKICDDRGRIMHMLKKSDEHYDKFGEIYFSTAYPGVIKGWHEHTKMTLNYCVIKGMIKLVLIDNRPKSSTYKKIQEIYLGEHNYVFVQVPAKIINGFKNISNEEAIIANAADIEHAENEIKRYDPHDKKFNYNWKLIDR